jgi:hypothetical protein
MPAKPTAGIAKLVVKAQWSGQGMVGDIGSELMSQGGRMDRESKNR